jgi:hypothetical protein
MAKTDRRFKYESEADKPVMLSLRVPRELNDRLERYASEHRQKVSELVRDAIEMRLEVEADPRSRRARSTTDDPELEIDGASILRDMQATLARHDTQMHAIMQAIERQTTPAGNGASDSHTAMPASDVAVSYQEASYTEVVTLTDEQIPESTIPATVPPFDTTRYRLGKLCPHGHDYHGTGLSLRRNNKAGGCLGCDAEQARVRRKAKRDTQSIM